MLASNYQTQSQHVHANNPSQPPSHSQHAQHSQSYSQSQAHSTHRQKPSSKYASFGPYKLIKTIGEGEFGKVKLAVHATSNKEMAIKLLKKENLDTPHRRSKAMREISILQSLDHPYIVKLYEVIETDSYIGMVMEYASGGELFEYILANQYLNEDDSRRFFAQLISGVSYMHKLGIVHRDLKLENLLLDRDNNILISDFGFANMAKNGSSGLMQTSCGSPCYAAPELVISDGYVGEAADIWSCGVILYAMLCGYLPFDDDPDNPDSENINLLYKYILETELEFPEYVPSQARSLMKGMLIPDPVGRSKMSDIFNHPWLQPVSHIFIQPQPTTSTLHDLKPNPEPTPPASPKQIDLSVSEEAISNTSFLPNCVTADVSGEPSSVKSSTISRTPDIGTAMPTAIPSHSADSPLLSLSTGIENVKESLLSESTDLKSDPAHGPPSAVSALATEENILVEDLPDEVLEAIYHEGHSPTVFVTDDSPATKTDKMVQVNEKQVADSFSQTPTDIITSPVSNTSNENLKTPKLSSICSNKSTSQILSPSTISSSQSEVLSNQIHHERVASTTTITTTTTHSIKESQPRPFSPLYLSLRLSSSILTPASHETQISLWPRRPTCHHFT